MKEEINDPNIKDRMVNFNIEKELKPIIKLGRYEYVKAIEYLKNYFPNYKYYNNLYNKIKTYNYTEELPQSDLHDLVIREYIKCCPDISIIVLFPKASEKENEFKSFINLLKKNGNIYYQKEVEVNYNMMSNLIYQQYINTFRMKSESNIKYKINRLGMNTNDIKKIKIIVFQPKEGLDIFGSSVNFKTELRNIFLEPDIKITKINPESDEYPRGHDYLHINDTFNEAIEYADIFFNKNTLNFLKRQVLSMYFKFFNSQIQLYFLKKRLYNIPIVEQYKIMITSSAILTVYGIRQFNDLDLMIMDDAKIEQYHLAKLLKNYDVSYKNGTDWDEGWEEELNYRTKEFSEYDNYNEFILDPNTSFYFSGMKFMRLKYELPIRALRKARPVQYADLIMTRKLLNLNYEIIIPKENMIFNQKTKEYEKNIVKKDEFIEGISKYLNKKYRVFMTIDEIDKYIQETVKNKKEELFG